MSAALLAAGTPRAIWYTTRGAGAAALVALTATMVLGIVDVRRVAGARWPRFVIDTLHRDVALVAVALLAVHIATAVIDSFAPIALLDAVIPFVSAYRPLWLGLGALAFDLLLALAITSLLRRRLGYRAWRAVHWAAYACWPLALVHGLGTGTDIPFTWMLALTLACAVATLAAVAWRVIATGARIRVPVLAAIAAICVLLVGWVQQGPLRRGWARRAGTPAALAAPAPVTATLPRTFTAALSGTLADQRSADGGRAALDLPLRFRGGVVDIRIDGLVTPRGLEMEQSDVTLGPAAAPALYRGRVDAIEGARMSALVRRSGGDALRLRLDLSIDGASVTGTITAEPAG